MRTRPCASPGNSLPGHVAVTELAPVMSFFFIFLVTCGVTAVCLWAKDWRRTPSIMPWSFQCPGLKPSGGRSSGMNLSRVITDFCSGQKSIALDVCVRILKCVYFKERKGQGDCWGCSYGF